METKPDFGRKVLTKDIRGQQLLPGPRYSFTHGKIETVHCYITFEFHHWFGGHTGSRLETPPAGLKWIRSGKFTEGDRSETNWTSVGTYIWEVKEGDLEGNYRDSHD